ncbi:unnamed protein product [Lupinus luteus]|uniref:Uncharacterized protein n=1 Tax=Lupinus luteus TaxID=3873 RepID=A0AAV1XPU2_LUPLU
MGAQLSKSVFIVGSISVSGYMLTSWFADSKVTSQSSAKSPIPSIMSMHLLSHNYLSSLHSPRTCSQLHDQVSLSPIN